MVRSYGEMYMWDFPNPDVVLNKLDYGDIAIVKEKISGHEYILNKELDNWAMLIGVKKNDYTEWVMAVDDFENGWGEQEYPHCSNCGRGVYRHDAGSWCPFCGAAMRNPMR